MQFHDVLRFCRNTALSSQTNQNIANGDGSKLPQMLGHSNAACEQLTTSPPQKGIEAEIFSPRLNVQCM